MSRHTRFLGLSFALLTAFFITPITTFAQSPVQHPVAKNVTVDTAVAPTAVDEAYKNGSHLALTLNNGDQINGTFVYEDAANGAFYIRSRPSELPQRVAWKNVKDVTHVRFVSDGGNVPEPPEIMTQTIFNGNIPSVTYVAPNLSVEERAVLFEIQEAKNRMLKLQGILDTGILAYESEKQTVTSTEIGPLRPTAIGVEGQPSDRLNSAAMLEKTVKTMTTDRTWPMTMTPEQVELMQKNLKDARDRYDRISTQGIIDNGDLIAVRLVQKTQ